MNDFEKLEMGICFVTFVFSDNSRHAICTSLNQEIVEKYGGTLIKGTLYDLIKRKYFNFREDTVEVLISDESPNLSEVDKFANQFI